MDAVPFGNWVVLVSLFGSCAHVGVTAAMAYHSADHLTTFRFRWRHRLPHPRNQRDLQNSRRAVSGRVYEPRTADARHGPAHAQWFATRNGSYQPSTGRFTRKWAAYVPIFKNTPAVQ